MTDGKLWTFDDAKRIGDALGVDWNMFPVEQFRLGLLVEREHGPGHPPTDVTHDDPLVTAGLVWAHLMRIPDYYTRLSKMEKDAAKYWGMERGPGRRTVSR